MRSTTWPSIISLARSSPPSSRPGRSGLVERHQLGLATRESLLQYLEHRAGRGLYQRHRQAGPAGVLPRLQRGSNDRPMRAPCRAAPQFIIPPTGLGDSTAYLRHGRALAGRSDQLFADDAIVRLHRLSNGIPRPQQCRPALIAVAADGNESSRIDLTVRRSALPGRWRPLGRSGPAPGAQRDSYFVTPKSTITSKGTRTTNPGVGLVTALANQIIARQELP